MKARIFGPFWRRADPTRLSQWLSSRAPRPILTAAKPDSSWGGDTMHRISLLAGIALLAFAALPMATAPAQTVALSGQITSAEEGAMEGVLVSAKKAGSTITITVVSDRDGRFSFPASKIEPGQYALRIRAIGYDLDNHKSIDVAPQKTTTLDLKLRKTEDIAAQLTNAEWINSIPGNDPRKGVFLNCVGCHTLERVMRSKHTSEEFLNVTLPRMQSYVNQSIPQHPQLRRAERLMEERGDSRVQIYKATADFLATVNLSSKKTQWDFPLNPFPRPGGRATRVIY